MSQGVLAVTIVGIVVVVFLVWFLTRSLSHDRIQSLLDKRKGEAVVANAAEYIEGPEKVDVALVLTRDTLYYENPDLQARIELKRIDEVEYDDDLVTGGRGSRPDGKVLRLRCHGQTFEFVVDTKNVGKWQEHLPAHHVGEPGVVHAE